MKTVNMVVNQRVNGKNVFKAIVAYACPTLADIPGSNLPEPDKWASEEFTAPDGTKHVIEVPEYSDDTLNYVQSALVGAVRQTARGRDETLSSWEDITEGASGTTYGAQLKAFKAALTEWLDTETEYSDNQKAAILHYCRMDSLAEADQARKERFEAVVQKFTDHAGEDAAEWPSVYKAINKAIATDLSDVDF